MFVIFTIQFSLSNKCKLLIMKINARYKIILIELICLLFVILFVYAAVSKLAEFQNFRAQLGQSPLISAYTGLLSIAVPVLEILIAVLLVIPKLRIIGILSAVSLMILFTFYIVIILNLSSFIPCSCGGILENMGWTDHLIFNTFFVLLGLWALLLSDYTQSMLFLRFFGVRKYDIMVTIALMTVINVSALMLLYYTSEQKLQKNNPFIRRFIQGSALPSESTILANNMYYFAGKGNGKIYLANNAAPLHIIEIDTVLMLQKRHKIELENYNYSFRSVQVQIRPPFFFLMDGNVPIVFRGRILDWKGQKIESPNIPFFSRAEIITSKLISYRGIDKNNNYILGQFTTEKDGKSTIKKELLKKQIDGFFDCDGMLQYDTEKKYLIYLYYYRNQFIVADSSLNLLHESHTIDTTEHARLKVVYLKERGERKLGAPPYIVNIQSTASQGRLLINSAITGRFEDKNMWKNASIVDVYDITEKTYLSSIYIYDQEGYKMDGMMLYGSNLYVLLGGNLQRYKLSKKLAGSKPENKHRPVTGEDRKPANRVDRINIKF